MIDAGRTRLFWTLNLGGWALFGVGMALSRLGRYPIDYMIATKTVLAASGVLFSLPLRALYRRTLREDTPVARTIAITATASFLVALAWTAFYNLADARIYTAMSGRALTIQNLSQLFSTSFYHTFALLAWSALYVVIKREESLRRERERALRAEARAHEATLQALRFQIQPHFLFNTLNAVSTLVAEEKSAEASRMLSRLSEFLRHTLNGPSGDEVALADELEFARRYLDIEQVRFGDRLAVTFDVPPQLQRARVPTLLLQPLLENAMRHGVAPRIGASSVRVSARQERDVLRLTVIDEGVSAESGSGAAPGNGVGLANTRARLEQLYGSRQSLVVEPTAQGHRVEVTLPFRE